MNVARTVTYEGQAAIALEMAATNGRPSGPYPFSVDETDGPALIRIGKLFDALCADARSKTPLSEIAFRFHLTVARMIGDTASMIASRTGIKTVVLSGGCFQNRLLTGLAVDLLRGAGLDAFTHSQVPCNDGGISLGQAAVAHASLDGAP